MSASHHSDACDSNRSHTRRCPTLRCHRVERHRHGVRRRGGFTLIELIAVAVIIAILAAMVMVALGNARTAGQVGATKAMIARLDAMISSHWQSYDTRRIPATSPAERLSILRQLMRMELPDNWNDVKKDSAYFIEDEQSNADNIPALCRAYRSYYDQIEAQQGTAPTGQFGNAECLYMIITIGLAGQGSDLSSFRESDVGDLDKDGAPEFHDAWGMPIRFLRWPIGFVTDPIHDRSVSSSDQKLGRLSDIMPPIPDDGGGPCWPDASSHPDPFDLFRTEDSSADLYPEVAFRVYPLIYSAGPDKIFDIYTGTGSYNDNPFVEYGDGEDSTAALTEPPSCTSYDVFGKQEGGSWSASANPRFSGRPKDLNNYLDGDTNDVLDHHDNIHNHRLTTD